MGKTFKPSNYNFFIPQDSKNENGTFLFNGLNSSLIRLPQEVHPIVQDILLRKHLEISMIPPEIKPLFNMLIEGGFVADSLVDELGIIKGRFQKSRKEGPLHLLIAPTMDCNLACSYCYQSRSPHIMTVDVCDEIIGFVREKLKKNGISDISIDWFGGEPLLAPEIISYLSKHFLRLAKEFGCEYGATMATNGTLLDRKALDMLMANKVESSQVTIDGPKEIHDNRRRYKQGNGSSFRDIIKNMRQLIGKIELTVRINIDADNIQYPYLLLDLFKKEGFFESAGRGFFPYMAIVGPINPAMHFSCRPVDIGRFYEYNLEFQKKVFEYSGKRQLAPILDFPSPINMACAALRKNSYAFDPRGYLFKCGLEIGEDHRSYAHISNYRQWRENTKWDEYDPFADKECSGCRYLPFCMGNCPKVEFDKNTFYGKDGCIYWKRNLENIIRLYVKAKLEFRGHNT